MGSTSRKKVFWIGALLLVLGSVWLFFTFSSNVWKPSSQTLVGVGVGENVVLAEVADSAEERARGLSGRDGLEKGRGMLFLFDPSTSSGQAEPAVQGFWMKDMRFPIDIIWVRDGKIIGFEEDVSIPTVGISESELPVYFSPGAIDTVLEVSAGTVHDLGIRVGDKFQVVI